MQSSGCRSIRIWVVVAALAAFGAFGATSSARAAEILRIKGSPTVAQALASAVPVMRDNFGVDMKFFAEGGSSLAVMAVGTRTAEVGMATRALTAEDRANFPERRLDELQIGTQALVCIVPRDVWDAGVHALTQDQVMGIYEGAIKNWSRVGGEDRVIKFYSPDRGRGVWELFVTWLYGDIRRAPLGKGLETVPTAKDARDLVEFNAGSLSIAPPQYADRKSVFALGLKKPDGSIVEPSQENISSGKYPVTRPLILVAGERPTGAVKKLFDFMISPEGQQIVSKAGFVPVKP
jgi:phosphate transport system substrate-binding protein